MASSNSHGRLRLARAIIAARKAAGLTQDDLAKKLDRSTAEIEALETGAIAPDVAELAAVARAVEVDPHRLMEIALGWDDKKKSRDRGSLATDTISIAPDQSE